MKKVLFAVIGILILGAIMPVNLDAKPIYLKVKLGIFAKWSVSFSGHCEDGGGLCIAFGGTDGPQNFFGYDDESNKCILKISKEFSDARVFSNGTYTLNEDSPIDPKITNQFGNFNSQGKKVGIKKGTYKVSDERDYYIIAFEYYLQ
jgi:hypothetical protein